MNTKALLAIAAFATVAAGAARADGSEAQGVVQLQVNRTRAEVQAEAATVPATRSIIPAAAIPMGALKSGVDTKLVRAQAAEAVRLGQIPRGEAGV